MNMFDDEYDDDVWEPVDESDLRWMRVMSTTTLTFVVATTMLFLYLLWKDSR